MAQVRVSMLVFTSTGVTPWKLFRVSTCALSSSLSVHACWAETDMLSCDLLNSGALPLEWATLGHHWGHWATYAIGPPIPGWPSKFFQKTHSEHKKTALRVKKPQIVKNLYLSLENLLNINKHQILYFCPSIIDFKRFLLESSIL